MSKKLVSNPFPPVLLRPADEFRRFFEGGVSYDVDDDEGGGDDTVSGAPMRTRMQCVGRELSRQINTMDSSQPGIGVTTSAGVYRSDTGKIFVSLAADSRDGENFSMPRPLLVVASGNTTITRPWFSLVNWESSTKSSCALKGSWMSKHAAIAPSRVTGRTRRLPGSLSVNIGSKIAAKYNTSSGDVYEEAMTVPGTGSLPRGVWDSDLVFC